jgi:hypothetical protein
MGMAEEAHAVADDAKEIAGLFSNAVEQLGKLVQNEVQLAKVETSEKVAQAGMGITYLVGAGILMIPVLVVLLITLALWIEQLGLSPVPAHLIAAGVGAVISIILAVVGKARLTSDKLSPKVTMQQVSRDLQAAKEFAR